MLARLAEQQPEGHLLESLRLFERSGSGPLPNLDPVHLNPRCICLLACSYHPDNVAILPPIISP